MGYFIKKDDCINHNYEISENTKKNIDEAIKYNVEIDINKIYCEKCIKKYVGDDLKYIDDYRGFFFI